MQDTDKQKNNKSHILSPHMKLKGGLRSLGAFGPSLALSKNDLIALVIMQKVPNKQGNSG